MVKPVLGLTTPEKRNLSAIVGEVISTSRGTSFYIHTTTSSEDQHGSGTFLTQDEESEGASLTFATENITILEQAFINAKNGFRLGFLEQLEQWRLEMISKAHETVAGKSEEANTELDLRLHLHEPRPSRIEQDLHHIRAAELESHRDRVSRHSQGLMASVNEQKTSTQKLAAQQELESEKFATEVMILESRLDSADKANKLSKIQDEAKHLLEKHLQHISLMSGSHRSHCEQALADLEDSNQSYKASLKLFSEGGNYCPEEVEQYSKRLNKLNSKIASARTFIGNEVSAMTNSHSEAAWEVMKQFEASYLLHSADLSFLEALSQTLTSAQVGIKSEVACSNGQARDIFQNIDKISATIKKVQAKEVPSSTLLAELSEFFTSLTRRADYLFCHSGGVRGARVGSHPEVAPSPSLVKSSGTPISAVNVTKSILEQTTARKRSGSSSDRDTGSRQSKAGVPATATHLEPQDRKGVVPASPSGMLLPDTQKKLGRQSISSHKRALAMERKHASFGIGGGEDGTDCFLPRIRAVLKTTHQALYSKADSYYKHKGTRPPTRPNEIQDTFEACIDSLITKCQLYRVQAEEYRNDCIEEFHGQLESAVAVLESVPGVVFGEVREEFQILLDKERTTRKEKYESTMRELRNTKECHEKCLRPGLGHPSQREQLENLCSKEEERHKASIKTTNQHTSAAKIGERQHTVKYILKLLESTKSLLTLFDSLTSSSDIIPGSDRHKSKPPVEKLLRLHVNQQLGSSAEHEEDTVAELTSASFTPSKLSGKMSGYVWSNLPESERKAIIDMLPPPTTISKKASGSNIARSTTSRKKMNASRLADRNASTEPPSSVNIGAGGRVGSGRRVSLLKQAPQSEETVLANMLVEKLVSSKWTSLHEAVIKTRDGAIQEYMKDYRDSTADTERQEEGVISVEEKWYRNWISSVDKIRQLYS